MSSGYFSDFDPKWVRQTAQGEALIVTPAFPVAGPAPFYSTISAFGELLTATLEPHALQRFDYGINTRLNTTSTTGSGSVTTDESMAILSTGTDNNGAATLTSIHTLRYSPGVGNRFRRAAFFTTGVANSRQIFGIGNAEDGLFFGFNGANFGVMRRRNMVDDWIEETSWNGDSPVIDKTLLNVYQITFQWLGGGPIRFTIEAPGLNESPPVLAYYRLAHEINYLNTAAEVSLLNPTLPLYAQVINTGNASDVSLHLGSGAAFAEGGLSAGVSPLDVANTASTLQTVASTDETLIISVHNKTTLNSVSNRVPVEISSIVLSRETTAVSSQIRFYRVATTADALSYTDVDANNSPVEYSVTDTTITGGTPFRSYTLTDALPTLVIDFRHGELILYPGESLTISTENSLGLSTDITVNVNWFEEF